MGRGLEEEVDRAGAGRGGDPVQKGREVDVVVRTEQVTADVGNAIHEGDVGGGDDVSGRRQEFVHDGLGSWRKPIGMGGPDRGGHGSGVVGGHWVGR